MRSMQHPLRRPLVITWITSKINLFIIEKEVTSMNFFQKIARSYVKGVTHAQYAMSIRDAFDHK